METVQQAYSMSFSGLRFWGRHFAGLQSHTPEGMATRQPTLLLAQHAKGLWLSEFKSWIEEDHFFLISTLNENGSAVYWLFVLFGWKFSYKEKRKKKKKRLYLWKNQNGFKWLKVQGSRRR